MQRRCVVSKRDAQEGNALVSVHFHVERNDVTIRAGTPSHAVVQENLQNGTAAIDWQFVRRSECLICQQKRRDKNDTGNKFRDGAQNFFPKEPTLGRLFEERRAAKLRYR
jgi:hypothetical protein